MQIAMMLYDKSPNANDLFSFMKANNFAIFHKEDPRPSGVSPQDKFGYSFVKLAPDFYG